MTQNPFDFVFACGDDASDESVFTVRMISLSMLIVVIYLGAQDCAAVEGKDSDVCTEQQPLAGQVLCARHRCTDEVVRTACRCGINAN